MNHTKYRNPGRAAARAFAAMALAATSFLVPGAAHAADEATAGPDTTDAVATEEAATQADAATTEAATASSEAGVSTCAVMRTAPRRHHGHPGPRPRRHLRPHFRRVRRPDPPY